MAGGYRLSAEDVAYWYLRLNGFLVLRNFLVHGDGSSDVRTEIDIVGVRFRYRKEHLENPMIDADWLTKSDSTVVVFCEVKARRGDFNPSWLKSSRRMLESFLAFVGVVPESRWSDVARELYSNGYCRAEKHLIITALLIHGAGEAGEEDQWKAAPRIKLRSALSFMHARFTDHGNLKRDHSQWEESGSRLLDLFDQFEKSRSGFEDFILAEIGAE